MYTEKLKPGQAQSSSTHCAFAPVLDAGFFPRVTTAATDDTANLIIHTLFGASNAPHHKGQADVYPAYALLLRSRIHYNDTPVLEAVMHAVCFYAAGWTLWHGTVA